VDHDQVVTHNVLARVVGKKRPNETVIYSAHWDHLGVGPPDAKGDRIYNGAVDNASGVAGVLELARAFGSGKQPDRSVVFMFTTAKEKGLLGATYYASHPLYPLATTVADFNVDGLDADGPAKDITVRGRDEVSLEDDLAAQAKARGRNFSPDPAPGAGLFFRADHFAFAKVGVPAMSIASGRNLVEGGRRAGDAWHDAYVAARYHQPADQWSPDMNFTGEAQDLGIIYAIGRDLAFSDRWPTWKAGSEFKGVRAATASARQ
jgi:Zn-dependent M28 family amino/carboxypeptidase